MKAALISLFILISLTLVSVFIGYRDNDSFRRIESHLERLMAEEETMVLSTELDITDGLIAKKLITPLTSVSNDEAEELILLVKKARVYLDAGEKIFFLDTIITLRQRVSALGDREKIRMENVF
jgi:hypothetical protein